MTPFRSLADEARAAVEKLGGRWSGRGGLCRCPAHTDRTPSLSVRVGRSRLLFHCFAGCSQRAVIEALVAGGYLGPRAPVAPVRELAAEPATRLQELARRLWLASRSIEGTAAERYLASRGLAYPGSALRFHPRAPFGRHPMTIFAPALIAAVHEETGFVAVHRTRLDIQRVNARGTAPRKASLGPLGTGAVRLASPGAWLGLAEGVEDALSVTALTGLPCWATLGAARFGRVVLPRAVSDLVLFLDDDAAGRRAERYAREAYGQRVVVHARFPGREGSDWNDVWLARSRRPAGLGRPAGLESKGGG